jgi:hypothetical protein
MLLDYNLHYFTLPLHAAGLRRTPRSSVNFCSGRQNGSLSLFITNWFFKDSTSSAPSSSSAEVQRSSVTVLEECDWRSHTTMGLVRRNDLRCDVMSHYGDR